MKQKGSGLTVALIAVLAGCGSPSGCDPCFTAAIVSGTVTYDDGAPVARVRLDISTYLSSCGVEIRGGEYAYTDSVGRYRSRVQSLFSPHTVQCIRIILNGEGAPGWPTDTTDFAPALEFRPREEERLDSAELNVVVPRPAAAFLVHLRRGQRLALPRASSIITTAAPSRHRAIAPPPRTARGLCSVRARRSGRAPVHANKAAGDAGQPGCRESLERGITMLRMNVGGKQHEVRLRGVCRQGSD